MAEPLEPVPARTPRITRSTTVLFASLVLVACLLVWTMQPGKDLGPRMWRNKRGVAEAQLSNLASALRQHRGGRGHLPTTLEALTVVTPPDEEPWLSAIPTDPWGGPYEYRIDGDRFTLRSFGEDGQPDTDDDIRWPRP